jgi:radical SAM superfamily enzyme YgiQ (UPF0313 family)
MQCTLIRCPQTLSKFVSAGYAVPPIGLAYVAASLAANGHEVEVIDTTGEAIEQYTPLDARGVTLRRGLTNEQILERLRFTDLIGFSLMFSQDWLEARELIRLVRSHYPNAALVAGGEHFSAEPEGAMLGSPLDFVLVGEGDRVICELIEHLEGKRTVEQVPGCWYRTPEGTVQKTGAMVRVKDIDTLPWPAWDLIPI